MIPSVSSLGLSRKKNGYYIQQWSRDAGIYLSPLVITTCCLSDHRPTASRCRELETHWNTTTTKLPEDQHWRAQNSVENLLLPPGKRKEAHTTSVSLHDPDLYSGTLDQDPKQNRCQNLISWSTSLSPHHHVKLDQSLLTTCWETNCHSTTNF